MARKRKRQQSSNTDITDSSAAASCKRQKTGEAVFASCQHLVLSRYYPKVQTLRQYLLSWLPKSSKSRRRKIAALTPLGDAECRREGQLGQENQNEAEDLRELSRLLDTTLVGVLDATGTRTASRARDFEQFTQQLSSATPSSFGEGTTSQSEIVDFAIWLLFNRVHSDSFKPPHVLCHGYQRARAPRTASEDICAMAGIPGLFSVLPNCHVSTIKGFPWRCLLKFLGKEGDGVMLDLMLKCGIFVPVTELQGNYYQLSGFLLSELPQLTHSNLVDQNLTVPKTSEASKSKEPGILRTPMSIKFVRNRMMYARSALNARGEVQLGLRHIHALNRYSDHSDIGQTTHMMKYIFPRQFKLHNVFTSVVDTRETSHPFKDYTLREQEIARSSGIGDKKSKDGSDATHRTLPKRLRGLPVKLVARIQKRHSRCSYSELLKHYCPVDAIDGQKCRKQAMKPHGSSSQLLLPSDLSDEGPSSDNHTGPTTSLIDASTSPKQVSAFCRSTVSNMFPDEVWGVGEDGQKNKSAVMQHIDQFVSLKRFENLTLHSVCQNLKIRAISWLAPPTIGLSAQTSKSDMEKRKEIFAEFIYYVFDSIVIPLIRYNFHVTESNVHRNRLFFFRHDLWRAFTEPCLTSLKLSMFEEMKTEQARRLLSARVLGFSQVRLLPKATGFRPIMNLRQKVGKVQRGKIILGRSINTIMTPVYNMLSYEKLAQPGRLGSAMFSVGDIYPRLKAFRAQVVHESKSSRPLYFVKVDVQSCFDTIPQSGIVKLMEELCTEEEYRVSRHAEIRLGESQGLYADTGAGAKITRKFIAKAEPALDFSTFEESLNDGTASGRKGTIYVDTGRRILQERDKLLYLLEEHIERNVVKIGKKYFRQKLGIPQGSILSSLLCNFFFAEFERERLGFLDKAESLLLRLIDDFLLITSNINHAKRFYGIMQEGDDKYGITCRPEKSLVNFHLASKGAVVPRSSSETAFPYCGIMINTKTLEITKDSTRRTSTILADSLTVETTKAPGKTFYRKIMNGFKIQIHAMHLDTSMNKLPTVLTTMYQNLLESAMKFYRYSKAMGSDRRPPSSLMIKTIEGLGELAMVLMQNKRGSHSSVGYKCGVTKGQLEWLTVTAFRHVLEKKQSNYQDVIAWLDCKLESLNLANAKEEAMLRGVVRKGDALFAAYKF